MTFKDLCDARTDLRPYMLVDLNIGSHNEALRLKDCLKKYGNKEVIDYTLIGSYARFLFLVLKED